MKSKHAFQMIVLVALLASFVHGSASALAVAPPPADIFQLPWTQGDSWVAMDGFDNGIKRLSTSPHNYKVGGAVDFAPNNNMTIGMDTSNFWVTAAAAGTVFETSSCHLKIDHGNGWITEYWHLDNLQVTKGTAVYRNQRLGIIANSKYEKVCLGNEYPGPHLHFVMRPDMKKTVFAGWTINYNALTNATTFSKTGKTVGSYQPILNVPTLQIAWRDAIVWDTLYTGSVDAYRYERWPLYLTETTKFTVSTVPITSSLNPVIALLDSNGNEIARASGTLASTQPAGTYFVQIQSQAGSGFYSMFAKREDSSSLTPTPTPTSTSTTPTATPTDSSGFTSTPNPTSTFDFTATPTPTGSSGFTATPTSTISSDFTATPTPTGSSGFTSTPNPTSTSGFTATPTPTGSSGFTSTPNPTSTSGFTATPTPTGSSGFTSTPNPTSTSEFTATPTPTDSSGFTATPTSTSSSGFTSTPNPTSTSDFTATPTPTSSSGFTPTPTSTNSPTPVPTPTGPYVSTVINPTSIIVGETSTVFVNLNNVPVEGYSSAEFTCIYNPTLLEASNIVAANLFGADPVAAINGPQNGSFIFAIAGSNGNRATTSGIVFSFSVKGVQTGQSSIECTARVSSGDQNIVGISSLGAVNLTIGNISTPTPSPTPLPGPVITGQVLASKPVTIRLYNADNSLATSLTANADGTFNLTAPAGNYTITASADGFLGAQGSATLTVGLTNTMSTVALLAGDIDNNGVIDQFDALTIGMGYNTIIPSAADLNNDGTINVLDLELLAQNYRKSGAVAWQ